jgi:hypothetical protein
VLDDTHLPWRLEALGDGQSRQDAWVRRIRFAGSAIVDCACDPCTGSRQAREIAATDGEFVSFRWGFTDSGNFARRFKQAYGIAPS